MIRLLAAAAMTVMITPALAQQPLALMMPPVPQTQQNTNARVAAPIVEPRNVCFASASLHRWCRVFVTQGPTTCACGERYGSRQFGGTLITDSQLNDYLGEHTRKAEVGANGRQYSRAQGGSYNGF